MDWTLEVVVVPVSDTERAIAFYRDQLGFDLDHHTQNAAMNFAQLTPPGSGCSIVVGELPGGPAMAPGSLKGLQLVVADAHRARDELLARGVDADEMQIIDDRDGGTLFGFADPDGNTWVVQQITARADKPLLPRQA
jgi:catechol 2,3-dioxygenase-like lactoylglutathione lyase family enzyme